MDLASNNLQKLMCHKIQTNKQKTIVKKNFDWMVSEIMARN